VYNISSLKESWWPLPSFKYIRYLLLLLGRYLCWWSISPRGYHAPSSRCFGTDMVY